MDGGVVVGGGSVGGGSARLSSLSNCPKPLPYQNDLKHPELPVLKKYFEFESIDWLQSTPLSWGYGSQGTNPT